MKIKQKFINGNKYKKAISENDHLMNTFQNKDMIIESNLLNSPLYTIHKFGKTSINFHNSESKNSHFQKALFQDSIKFDNTKKLKLKFEKNNKKDKILLNLDEKILPYINSVSVDNEKKNIFNLNNNHNNKEIQIFNYYTNLNSSNESTKKDNKYKYNKIIKFKKIGSKEKDIEREKIYFNTENNISRKNEIHDDKEFKYSMLLKNLDIWDKDHCKEKMEKSDIDLFSILNEYYIKNNLINEQKNLMRVSNILKLRGDYNILKMESKQNNKLLIEMIKRKKKETGMILKNNLYKAQIKFGELFNKRYTKEFNENLNIDPDTLNLLIEDELKTVFYNQVIRERIKYENQLHDDLLNVNNLMNDRKNIKNEKIYKLKELFIEKAKLKKEYEEKYNKNRNTYWNKYENYDKYYKRLISNSNINANNNLKNIEENFDNNINKKFLSNKNISIYGIKKNSKSPSPSIKFRRRLSAIEIKVKENLKKQIKEIEDEKKFKLLYMNNEMNSKLKEMQKFYLDKIYKINEEEKVLEDEIKIIKLELEYYKKINDELYREHKLYYMKKLKKGFDCRKEGLAWIVANLLELQVPLEYHHFPKYLTHEQINYLKKFANLTLKQKELKIIINVLKKKQNTQKMNDVLKCMDMIDNIIDADNNENGETLNDFYLHKNHDYLVSKSNIDKKFYKLYKENIDNKNIENYEFQNVIYELKKDLYYGSNSDINKSKRNILNVFMGDSKNKNFFQFLLDIKSNYHYLEEQKKKLFENQKKNFLKLVESSRSHKASISTVIKNEMIKRCLFGSRLDI